jgi:hypothetical protein
MEVYTVWVDGLEMSQDIYNLQTAKDIADDWKRLGFTDVDIMCQYKFEE